MHSGDYDSIVDDQSLRGILAKDAIESGLLPTRPANRMSDGPREGVSCTICAQPLSPQAPGYQLEFKQARQSATHFLHVPCFAAWESQCRASGPTNQAGSHVENARGNGHINGHGRRPG
jgi:hypothetical protein